MFIHQLEVKVNPRKLALSEQELSGVVDLKDFPRISSLLLIDKLRQNDCEVSLSFEKNQEGLYCVLGSLKATLTMQCQRCLGPVTLVVETNLCLALAWHEDQEKSLIKNWDTLIVEDTIVLKDLIEDELLLALPIMAYHPPEDCGRSQSCEFNAAESSDLELEGDRKDNAFCVLSKLKADRAADQEEEK